MGETAWFEVHAADLALGGVKTVVAGGGGVCLARIERGLGALDDRCPHQGGPLGEGTTEGGWLICPWHGYEYDPLTGEPPAGYDDAAAPFPISETDGAVLVGLPEVAAARSLMDQMVDVMVDWGVDSVFGMVGHSNLGLADALRTAAEDGRLRFYGIRHEGAAAFVASAYGKLTGRPAACFSIAGPGATNLLTGLWDANLDRSPVLALTGQVNTQVLGPGAFQEVPPGRAFDAVTSWSQTVLQPVNATESMALSLKHAIVGQSVGHLIFPDEVQEMPGLEVPPARPMAGRVSSPLIAPASAEVEHAIGTGRGSAPPRDRRRKRGTAVRRQGHRPRRTARCPHHHDLQGEGHDRRRPSARILLEPHRDLGEEDDDPGGCRPHDARKVHPVDLPIWTDIGVFLEAFLGTATPRADAQVRTAIAERWSDWRTEKRRRSALRDERGWMHPAKIFAVLRSLMPDDAVIAVDVGDNTYAFGHYFESKGGQDVLMSGCLGSIGFALPAALGAYAATGGARPIVSISGDGGLGQYLAEFTTAVEYAMPITHIVLNNDELAKISREQVSALLPVLQTDLVNPDFAAYAEMCGGRGFRIDRAEDLETILAEALAVADGPSIVEIRTSPRWT